MKAIRVVRPGFQTTVQDLGRFGHAHEGVSASGAADALALRAANLLVGNAENAAALEMTLVGGVFAFDAAAVVALTGSDFNAGMPVWRAVEVQAGDVVRCGASNSGARCYLAVRGGIADRQHIAGFERLRAQPSQQMRRPTAQHQWHVDAASHRQIAAGA